MFRFERTTDLDLVRQVVTHPAIWPWVSDDFSPPVEEWKPTEHPAIWYVAAWDDAELLGVWIFEVKGASWETHTCVLPSARGRRAVAAARELARWIWAETPCFRIVTNVPANNPAALWFARVAGMSQYGRNPQSWLQDGILYDQILLGMSRE